ncbi:adenine phosphoribosyltransferase [Acetilactobacillus jinshanensis]|uniref:Adenine phosphoribosyltransferase n=1 Tax=Acetilactobacillus jinshanensis TaxID=1720083 RepID=A0A4P6ZJW5_9LACO|nr:adenine phosphoribosyltransferase [Acetilactobacillus jinshanensis]QBP17938.1 adenine phosphoribosyltransferase [Acetilactobacillus jinshanensis]URL60801.1 adenine phosphoribosyltransferase [uncultured bacterium]
MAVDLTKYISSYKDFPKKGILFRDISPLIENPDAFREATNRLAAFAKKEHANLIAAPEARGFIVGSPVAYKLGIGFVPARKKGKLPTATVSASYGLEYGKSTLYMEKKAIKPGDRVVILDDLLATGGTYSATAKLVKQLKGNVVGAGFIIELSALKGRNKIGDVDTMSLIKY